MPDPKKTTTETSNNKNIKSTYDKANNNFSLIDNVRNKPTENINPAESTGINRPESHTADQLNLDVSSKNVLDMVDMGFYSKKYGKSRIAGNEGYPQSKYDVTRSSVNPSKTDYKMPTGKDDIDFSKTKFETPGKDKTMGYKVTMSKRKK
tara:strand:- start:46 stop:495 length:450 start_codon:yes stop_codon:yes gene_type:complete